MIEHGSTASVLGAPEVVDPFVGDLQGAEVAPVVVGGEVDTCQDARSMRPSAQARPTSGPDTFWSLPQDGLLAAAAASTEGLSAAEAARRLARDGPNTIEVAHPHRGLRLLLAQFTSPIVLIRSNSLFMGTHVGSGAGQAIVAQTGR